MDSLFQAAASLSPPPAPETSSGSNLPRLRSATTNDQRFLLLFIMGNYFGPDVKSEEPRKSANQRLAEGLPPYISDHLGGSFVQVAEIERIYFYILRNSDPSVQVKLALLHKFFLGRLSSPEHDANADPRQFPDFFPFHLHRQAVHRGQQKVVENIVFIHDPDVSYVKQEDIGRFKKLTGLENVSLERAAAREYNPGLSIDGLEEWQANGKLPLKRPSSRSNNRKKRKESENLKTRITPMSKLLSRGHQLPYTPPTTEKFWPVERVGPALVFLPSHPSREEWDAIAGAANGGISLTGTVVVRQPGPLIGLVDIGVSEDSYLFRISLPGVRKDEREFSCEVECDGRVMIRGVTTTGGRRVFKFSRVFDMHTQYLCPSGAFTISFQLPGPVEPQEFSGNFGSDGILEGVVMKERRVP
ncbi:hypothetical protein AMTRI_Chr01g137660 [Amborella trichopoda]|uniref:SHSP domain-containing protein n=1 Tax=Amborella trichopoda TaxID=13333 RepID=W1PWX3_AMBTC|nr:increased DNA methylation 2 [Amborella trichopoda]ERN12316.1 hypothetical protein AMTR_s00025p00054190 [Amborella trichopoda]|eukprot:XP_006850735.1 increased DNA methylation 2 [Amborella trichopoda]